MQEIINNYIEECKSDWKSDEKWGCEKKGDWRSLRVLECYNNYLERRKEMEVWEKTISWDDDNKEMEERA